MIHWQGGDHTALQVKKNRTGQHRWSTAADVVDLVRVLARQMPDRTIAAVLNRAGKSTGEATAGPVPRVHGCAINTRSRPIERASAPNEERSRLDEAAAALKVSASTVRRLIEEQGLPAQQLCKGAPWVIEASDLERSEVKHAAQARRFRRPASGDPRQKELEL